MGDILNRKAKNGIKKLQIREAVETDLNDVLLIERLAQLRGPLGKNDLNLAISEDGM